MILINLLPEDHRQKRRTPLKFLAVVSATVAVNGTMAAFWAWTAFGVAAEVEADLQVLKDTESGLQPQVAYHKDLESESKLFDSREATLKQVTESRVSWTSQVDNLVGLINDGGDGDKYLIWLDGLEVDTRENKRDGTAGKLKASAHSGTANFTHVANFLEDIEGSALGLNFLAPRSPEGTVASKNPDLSPSEIWNFPLEMGLKTPEERGEQ